MLGAGLGSRGLGGWRAGRGGELHYLPTFLRVGTAHLSPPAACPPSCTQGQGAAKGPGEPADSAARRVAAAVLAGAAFWVNIVPRFFPFFFFLFKQALPGAGHITLDKASQCC